MGDIQEELLREISLKLDRIIAILAVRGQDPEQQIRTLRALKFDWQTIGAVVGLSPDAARMRGKSRAGSEKKGK
ncbi:MAG: hypothetical protein ACRDIX_09390 [Actinomycetota bacterium]